MIRAHSYKEIPTTPHTAVLLFKSVHVPEMGAWAPGHGYPAHDEEVCDYIIFDSADELQEWVENNYDHGKFVVLRSVTLEVKKHISVSIHNH